MSSEMIIFGKEYKDDYFWLLLGYWMEYLSPRNFLRNSVICDIVEHNLTQIEMELCQ